MTPISLQGEPGEPGSPGVQGEPGVKVSGSSEALLFSPLHPLNPTPTFPLTSWSWNSCTAHESVLPVILCEAWSLDPGGLCPPFLEGKRGRGLPRGTCLSVCTPMSVMHEGEAEGFLEAGAGSLISGTPLGPSVTSAHPLGSTRGTWGERRVGAARRGGTTRA